MVLIETKGFDILEKEDLDEFDKLVNEYSNKLQKKLKNINSFVINLKSYKKEGNKKKFSIHTKITGPFKTLEASSYDWDFSRTIHKVFRKLENEIEKNFHISDQHKR